MKLFLTMAFSLGLLVLVTSLDCNICKFHALSICFGGSSVEACNGTCSTVKATVSSVSLFRQEKCMDVCVANNGTKDNIFGFNYTSSCCSTDKCNSGSTSKLSLSLGLGMMLMWLLKAL